MDFRSVFIGLVGCIISGCGSGDDSSTDSRICIFNDNSTAAAPVLEQQAEDAGLEFTPAGSPDGPNTFCGTTVQVDAIVSTDSPSELASALAAGRRL